MKSLILFFQRLQRFKYINEDNNTFIAEVENIFAEGRRKMYEYLSLSAYTKSSTDIEMLEKLLYVRIKVKFLIGLLSFIMVEVVPIILSPDSINLHIWDFLS